MKITVRLVARPDKVVLRLQSPDGKTIEDMRKVVEYINQNKRVLGFEWEFRSDGTITFLADSSQLRHEIVQDMREVIAAALRQI